MKLKYEVDFDEGLNTISHKWELQAEIVDVESSCGQTLVLRSTHSTASEAKEALSGAMLAMSNQLLAARDVLENF